MYLGVTSLLTVLSTTSVLIWGQYQGMLFVNNIIQRFKQTTLPFREDSYQNNLPILDNYDYVIVGASPSGCVLANRLSEDPNKKVLLLEAGVEPNFMNDIPIFGLLMFNTEYNWKFTAQYDPNVCKSMVDERCPWPLGKGVGGGTVINALLYMRGNKQDYDEWAQLGNKGWGYDDLLEYFNRLENTDIPDLRKSPSRGKDGPLWVSYAPYRTNASLVFLDAGKELGYPIIDYNLPYKAGFAKMQLSMKQGARSSASNAYLKPIAKRKNLHLVQRAMVTKIIIDSTTKTAKGVEFFKKGKKRQVFASRETIIAAGSFGSPKLLMLSGIGPRDHLETFNIEVVKDLPVGNNLQEHVGVTSLTFLADPSEDFLPNYASAITQLPIRLIMYELNKDGLPSSSGPDSLAYVSSRYATDDNPDVELLFVGASYASDYGQILRKTAGLRDDVYNDYYRPLEKESTFSVWVMGCYPKSRGTVRLSSRDPMTPPVIANNFLNRTEDLVVIVDGIKKAVELSETKVMKKYGVRLHRKNLPGCEKFVFGSDEYWECTVRQITAQFHHPVGTCKMGPDDDPTAVVDNRLRVRGIKKLRVVDCSIIPIIPAGHTMAPAFMIGEKGADLIKEDNS